MIHWRSAACQTLALGLALVMLCALLWPTQLLAQAENTAEASASGTETAGSDDDATAATDDAQDAAGNVADVAEVDQPAVLGEAGDLEAIIDATGQPGDQDEDSKLTLSEEEWAEWFPDIVEEQPGFIPDTEPSDLFIETPGLSGFNTLLGETAMPPGAVTDTINFHMTAPGVDLPENYARIVVHPGGTVLGSTETKQFSIRGGVFIYYSGVTITAENADIDEKNEVALLYDNVTINDPEYTLKASELRIYFEDKRFQAKGFVQFRKMADSEAAEPDLSLPKKDRLSEYFAGQSFELFCSTLFYDWDTLEMTAIGSVQLNHPSFNSTQERLDYNDETKEYELGGGVVLEVSDYGWVFENKLVEGDDEQKVQALTDGNTKITCERVVYSEESGVAEFYAFPNSLVTFEQPTRSITAPYIEVNDNTKDFFAEGTDSKAVHYQQADGEWLFAGGLIGRDSVDDDMAEALEGPMTMDSRSLAYNFDRKRLELLGQVRVSAGEKLLQADEMIQDDTAKFFLLRGNVLLKPDSKSQVVAAQVFVDTESDVITLVGLVNGELQSDDLPDLLPEEQALGVRDKEPGGQDQVAEGVFSAPTSGDRGTSQAGDASTDDTNVAEGG